MTKLTLKVMYQQWKELTVKATLSGKEALEAVKNDGYALRYVKEHVFKAEISLEA